jgi:flagellar biosynthesis/type III secretory pathway protein FliH
MSRNWARTDFWPTDRVVTPVVDDYARGLADGRATVEAELAGDREALAQLIASLEVLTPPSPEMLTSMMLATVERLVGDIVGAAPIDAALLNERAAALAAFITGEVEPVLALNPDDLALLDNAQLTVQLVADPALSRGTVEARSNTCVAEDGVGPAIARLHREFARLGVSL